MKPKPKMKRILITLRPDQVDLIKGNRSGYIQKLIDRDRNRETRYEYVWPIVRQYAIDNIEKGKELELISDLTMKLARQISGSDVLTELMGDK